MNKKIGIIIVLLVLIAILIGISVGGNSISSYKIGVVSPVTGNTAYLGTATVNGIRLATNEINEKFGQNTIELIVEDSKGLPADGVTSVQKIISIHNPDVIFSELTGVSLAISPIAQKSNKVLVYSAFTPDIVNKNPLAVKVFLDFEYSCNKFAQNVLNNSKVLILDETKTNGEVCLQGLLGSDRTNKDSKVELIDSSSDYRTILLKAKNDGYEHLVLACYEKNCINIIKQMIVLGIKIPIFCNKDACATEKVIKEIGVQNMPRAIFFSQRVSPSYIERYKREYGATSPESDILYSSTGYDSVYALFDSLKLCMTKDNSCVLKEVSNRKSNPSSALEYRFDGRKMISEIDFFEIKDGIVSELK